MRQQPSTQDFGPKSQYPTTHVTHPSNAQYRNIYILFWTPHPLYSPSSSALRLSQPKAFASKPAQDVFLMLFATPQNMFCSRKPFEPIVVECTYANVSRYVWQPGPVRPVTCFSTSLRNASHEEMPTGERQRTLQGFRCEIP